MEEKYCLKCGKGIPADSEYHYCKSCEKKITEREIKWFLWKDAVAAMFYALLHPIDICKTFAQAYKNVKQKMKASQ